MGRILIVKDADFSAVAVAKVTPEVDGPIITITSEGNVTIVDSSATAIYYTTDESTPITSSTQYISEFTVANGTTVKAISIYSDGTTSSVASKTYSGSALPDADLYFPLTSNSEEYSSKVTADKELLVSYSDSDGATFSGNQSSKAGIRYDISALSNQISTIYLEFKNTGSDSSYQQFAVSLYQVLTAGTYRLSMGVLGTSLQAAINGGIDGKLSVAYETNSLNKVAIRVNSDNIFDVFLNGSKVYSLALSGSSTTAKYLTIGNSWKIDDVASDTRSFQGSIKNVRCYYDALTDGQMTELTA